jgi:hypothetical protein
MNHFQIGFIFLWQFLIKDSIVIEQTCDRGQLAWLSSKYKGLCSGESVVKAVSTDINHDGDIPSCGSKTHLFAF